LKLNHNLFPRLFASKKYRKASIEGVWPKWLHKMVNALMKAQLLGCSWAGATSTSVSKARLNPVKGKQTLTRLKTVEYIKKKGGSSGDAQSSTHTGSPALQGMTLT